MATQVRPPAVAGTFYPGSAAELSGTIDGLLAANSVADSRRPKALIVPHAGYIYSGAIAAAGFARIRNFAETLERVVVVSPAHRVYVEGLTWPGAAFLATPLGQIAVDVDAIGAIPELIAHPHAHAREHAIEVELPFIQKLAPHAKVIPIAASHAAPHVVGKVLDQLWGGPETLIVISSDLSHYHGYEDAHERDRRTAAKIIALDTGLEGEEACGCTGINGLAWVARKRHLRVEVIDLRNSGDTAGPRDEVVGYGAFALYEEVQ
ncbi:MAG TPA: AmmeMemoRadiSam system protein B [Kofleriaceae bacterium]